MLLLGLVSYSFVVLHENERSRPGRWWSKSQGRQFAWSYAYPRVGHRRGSRLKTTQLYVPNNESVEFQIHSLDVIHAFWIPAFRLQIDAVPGITTSYLGQRPTCWAPIRSCATCSCGVGHSLMRSTIHVVTPAQFRIWLKHQTSTPSSA